MSKVLVTESSLSDIAGAIRTKLGVATQYKPGQMAAAIASIPAGGPLQQKTATENGEVTPDSGYFGLSKVTVNVSGGGGGGGTYHATSSYQYEALDWQSSAEVQT